MGCAVFLLSMIGPRVALFFVWVFTDFVDRAFDKVLLPVLGFAFLPWTTLLYVLWYDANGINSVGWVFIALALIGDISSYAGSARSYRARSV
jgi:hypothetical protein